MQGIEDEEARGSQELLKQGSEAARQIASAVKLDELPCLFSVPAGAKVGRCGIEDLESCTIHGVLGYRSPVAEMRVAEGDLFSSRARRMSMPHFLDVMVLAHDPKNWNTRAAHQGLVMASEGDGMKGLVDRVEGPTQKPRLLAGGDDRCARFADPQERLLGGGRPRKAPLGVSLFEGSLHFGASGGRLERRLLRGMVQGAKRRLEQEPSPGLPPGDARTVLRAVKPNVREALDLDFPRSVQKDAPEASAFRPSTIMRRVLLEYSRPVKSPSILSTWSPAPERRSRISVRVKMRTDSK